MRTTSTYFLGITCLLIHAAGCGGDPSPADSTTTGAGGGGTATSTGTGGSAATSTTSSGVAASSSSGAGGDGACIVPTGTCDAPDQCGPTTPSLQIMENLPDGQGGTVEDGTYWFTSFTGYSGPGSDPQDLTGYGFGGTFVLGGGMVHMSNTQELPGPPPKTLGYSGTFVTSMNTFTMDLTCGPKTGITAGSYTVSGKKITLYIPNPGTETGQELVMIKQ